MLFFMPQIIKSLGNFSNMTVGWLTMIPYICGGISMVTWGYISDRMNERRWNLLGACVVSTAGLIIAGMTMGTWWALVGMSIAAIGFYGSKGPFWSMPPMFLTGMAAAGAIAWINSLGNLGGFFGSWYVGFMKDLTGSYAGGLYGLALFGLVSAFVCAFFLHIPDPTVSARAPKRCGLRNNRGDSLQMTQTVARLLAESFEAHDVDQVYCVPGESYVGLTSALIEKNSIRVVVCRHEGGAGFMAVADGRLRDRAGVALVSRGPGSIKRDGLVALGLS